MQPSLGIQYENQRLLGWAITQWNSYQAEEAASRHSELDEKLQPWNSLSNIKLLHYSPPLMTNMCSVQNEYQFLLKGSFLLLLIESTNLCGMACIEMRLGSFCWFPQPLFLPCAGSVVVAVNRWCTEFIWLYIWSKLYFFYLQHFLVAIWSNAHKKPGGFMGCIRSSVWYLLVGIVCGSYAGVVRAALSEILKISMCELIMTLSCKAGNIAGIYRCRVLAKLNKPHSETLPNWTSYAVLVTFYQIGSDISWEVSISVCL